MSLGFHSSVPPLPRRAPPPPPPPPQPAPAPAVVRPVIIIDRPTRPRNILGLALLNLLLCGVHIGAAVVVLTTEIKFPVSVFETRLKPEVLANFTCIYDYGLDRDGERFCTTEDKTPTGNFSNMSTCEPIVMSYETQGRMSPSVRDGGPLLDAYELLRFNDNESGRQATRWVLAAIAAITATFHLVYSLVFARAASDQTTLNFFLHAGGVPARWYEYAFTASLMTLFTANIANVFDIYALTTLFLATFAMMYFGLAAEAALYRGDVATALQLIYIPATALFVAGWIPSLRQVANDLSVIMCALPDTFIVGCAERTCFGHENPIGVFVLLLLLLFVVFPLILLQKVYFVGGYSEAWTRRTRRLVDRACSAGVASLVMIGVHLVTYLVFILVGPLIAVHKTVSDVLLPLCNVALLRPAVAYPSAARRLRGLVVGEYLYALASVTSKLFLIVYFLMAFAQRDW